MDSRLTSLINDYQNSVREALILMRQSGIKMPYTSHSWNETNLSHILTLNGGIPFLKHGVGCQVGLLGGAVDFDFGDRGEISGLDAWRLTQFADNRFMRYGFSTKEEIRDCFMNAVEEEQLIQQNHNLYYAAGKPLEYASEIDSRNKTDLLPHKNHDDVLTLYVHYFYAADLMRKNYESLNLQWQQNDGLDEKEEIKLRIYMNSWLGFLAVTCEGFKKMSMRPLLLKNRPVEFQELLDECDKLNSEMKKHSNHLRKFRNNVFHLRENLTDTLAFFEPGKDRLAWARSIHTNLEQFFSQYRVLCECHYIVNDRASDRNTI